MELLIDLNMLLRIFNALNYYRFKVFTVEDKISKIYKYNTLMSVILTITSFLFH